MTVENVYDRSHVGWPAALIAGVVAIALLISSIALTQSDGDLFAHIALGREILAWGVPSSVTPAWGGAVVLVALDRLGGLALIAVCVAALAAVTHALLVVFVLQRGVSRRIALSAAMFGFVFAASHWLARPHAVTIAASALLVVLLERGDRRAWMAIPLLFALWANLHGGWSYGLILVTCYAVGQRTWPSLVLLATSSLATMLTPYGWRLHVAVVQTLRDPAIARVINEYQPPSVHNAQDLLFLVTLTIAAVALLRAIRRGPSRPPLAALLVIVVSAAAALRAGRNISLFAVTGWPLLVVYLAPHAATPPAPESPASAPAPRRAIRPLVATVAAALLLPFVALGIRSVRPEVSPARFPVGAIHALRRANVSAPLLTTWAWSGYVPYAWPGRHAVFNPLEFTPAEVDVLGEMLLTRPRWRQTLDSLHIGLAVLPPHSPLADSLAASAQWSVRDRDSTAVVYQLQAQSPKPKAQSPKPKAHSPQPTAHSPPPTAHRPPPTAHRPPPPPPTPAH